MSTLVIVKFCNVSRHFTVHIRKDARDSRYYCNVSQDRIFELNRIVHKAENERGAIVHSTRLGFGYSARITDNYT